MQITSNLFRPVLIFRNEDWDCEIVGKKVALPQVPLICYHQGQVDNIILAMNRMSFLSINTAFCQTMPFKVVTLCDEIGHFGSLEATNQMELEI